MLASLNESSAAPNAVTKNHKLKPELRFYVVDTEVATGAVATREDRSRPKLKTQGSGGSAACDIQDVRSVGAYETKT
jgi:hypothetical protein